MARKPKTGAAGASANSNLGHNAGLNDDERADLVAYFSSKIREQRKRHASAKATADAERDAVNALFSKARGELRMNRKEFEEVLAAQDMSETEFLAAEAKRLERLRLGGLPVGQQLDLFQQAPAKDTVDEKVIAENAGYRAGIRGDDPQCPSNIAPILRADWEAGWARGQKELGERMIRAMKAMADRQAKKPELQAGDDPDGDGDDESVLDEFGNPDPEKLRAAAKKLSDAGWDKPSAAEAQFEGAAA